MSQARPRAWWRQVCNDLELAEMASRNGFHARACFFANQAAEKALKGAIVELGCRHQAVLPALCSTVR